MISDPRVVSASRSTINPATAEASGIPDLPMLFNGKGTHNENVIEFAGRVCYRSTGRMGDSPDFIAARVRDGHTDILEHSALSMSVEIIDLVAFYRKCKYLAADIDPIDRSRHIVSGNFRAWLMYFSRDEAVMMEASSIAPAIFGRKTAVTPPFPSSPITPLQLGQAKVAMLSRHRVWVDDNASDHNAATFMIDGISRTCSHQLVRHRLNSVSQESQRYVDLEKGGWQAIVPPKIAEKPEAMAVMAGLWDASEAAYGELREMDIRKEDARFLLPNAAETRMVVSSTVAGWKHFLDQRATKAAQWEIRRVAEMIEAQLGQAKLLGD